MAVGGIGTSSVSLLALSFGLPLALGAWAAVGMLAAAEAWTVVDVLLTGLAPLTMLRKAVRQTSRGWCSHRLLPFISNEQISTFAQIPGT